MRYDEMKPKTQQFLSLFADGDQQYLVGGLEHDFYDFPYIGNVIIPTDFHIFQRGRAQPPTRYTFIFPPVK
jgi:hypothetical protein